MKHAPEDWTIRAFEKRGKREVKHFLLNMPDRTARQTLCVMPDTKTKPEKWDDVKNGPFWIINGQHSVEASKEMKDTDGVPQSTVDFFETWNCFIVWTENKEKLRKISAYYNRVNHFQAFKPSWSTNIIASRSL